MALSSPHRLAAGTFADVPDEGLFPISVVTELTGVGAHALRGYERAGLLCPARSDGGMRRYSTNDLAVIRRVAALAGEGVNLAGIRRILALESELASLRAQIDDLGKRPAARRGSRR
jgi:DNA-binding transcriptional MerR regulator